MERNPSEIIIIEKIFQYLKKHPESSISRISIGCRLNRRTVTKYLKLFKWVKNRLDINEQKGKRGARVFSVVQREEDTITLTGVYRDYTYAAYKIRKIASDLDLSDKTFETATYTYFDLLAMGIWDCQQYKETFLDIMTAAVVYLVCQKYEKSKALEEISGVSNIDTKSIASSCDLLEKALRTNGEVRVFSRTCPKRKTVLRQPVRNSLSPIIKNSIGIWKILKEEAERRRVLREIASHSTSREE